MTPVCTWSLFINVSFSVKHAITTPIPCSYVILHGRPYTPSTSPEHRLGFWVNSMDSWGTLPMTTKPCIQRFTRLYNTPSAGGASFADEVERMAEVCTHATAALQPLIDCQNKCPLIATTTAHTNRQAAEALHQDASMHGMHITLNTDTAQPSLHTQDASATARLRPLQQMVVSIAAGIPRRGRQQKTAKRKRTPEAAHGVRTLPSLPDMSSPHNASIPCLVVWCFVHGGTATL